METLTEVNDATVLLWRPYSTNIDTAVLLILKPSGELMSVEAIVHQGRSRSAIRAAIVTSAQQHVQEAK